MINFPINSADTHNMITSNLISELYHKVKQDLGPNEAKELISDIIIVSIGELEDRQESLSDSNLIHTIELKASDFLEVLNKRKTA